MDRCRDKYRGSQRRDFIYVTDIAEGTIKALTSLGYEVINLGDSRPYSLSQVVGLMEDRLGAKARVKHLPPQIADMVAS